jgi:outer membrane lipoprotein SlyB
MPGASLGRASSLGAGRRGSSSALPRHMHVQDASPSPSLGAGPGAGGVSGRVVGSTTGSAMGSALGSTAASTVGSGAGSRTGSGMGSGMGSTSSGEVLGRLELSEKDRAK